MTIVLNLLHPFLHVPRVRVQILSLKVACPCDLGVSREDERPTRCREEVAIAEVVTDNF